MYYAEVVHTNKHQVFSSSSNIFYRIITAVTKIPTNSQNCIKEEVPYVTPVWNSARLPTTKWEDRNHLFLLRFKVK
jgi:hypothetical protein